MITSRAGGYLKPELQRNISQTTTRGTCFLLSRTPRQNRFELNSQLNDYDLSVNRVWTRPRMPLVTGPNGKCYETKNFIIVIIVRRQCLVVPPWPDQPSGITRWCREVSPCSLVLIFWFLFVFHEILLEFPVWGFSISFHPIYSWLSSF